MAVNGMNQTTEDETMLLKIPEACAALRISRATFYREMAAGRISTVPIGRGRSRRVTPAAVAEYVRRREQEAQAGA